MHLEEKAFAWHDSDSRPTEDLKQLPSLYQWQMRQGSGLEIRARVKPEVPDLS